MPQNVHHKESADLPPVKTSNSILPVPSTKLRWKKRQRPSTISTSAFQESEQLEMEMEMEMEDSQKVEATSISWPRPTWESVVYNLKAQRPAGVFVLRHQLRKHVYWGTGWDLYEVMREQMDLVASNKHPDQRFNYLDSSRKQLVHVVVVKEVSLPETFQLSAFEDTLNEALKVEQARYRSIYTNRLVQLYRLARSRMALRRWEGKVEQMIDIEDNAAAIEMQRIVRGFLVRFAIASSSFSPSALPPKKQQQQQSSIAASSSSSSSKKRETKKSQEAAAKALALANRNRHHRIHKEAKNGLASIPSRSTLPVHKLRRHRGPFLGYKSKTLRDQAKHRHQRPYALIIQRIYRGYRERKYVKSTNQCLRARLLKRHAAAHLLQHWFRRCLQGIRAKEELIELRYIAQKRLTLQRVWRGHRGRVQFHARFDKIIARRIHGAITAQRVTRGYIGRQLVQYMRRKALLFRMAARIICFFQRSLKSLKCIRAMILDRRNKDATVIQQYTRRMIAKRVLKQNQVHKRCEVACQAIQLCYHRYKYRKIFKTRHCLQAMGACDLCISVKAAIYVESTTQRLCQYCYHRTMEVLYLSHGGGSFRNYLMADYRKFTQAANRIQSAYRRYVKIKKQCYGVCKLCSRKAIRRYCFHCRDRTCHTCGEAVHSMRLLRAQAHHKVEIEVYKRQRRAAEGIVSFFLLYRPKMKLYARFRNDREQCSRHAATVFQALWRGCKTRMVYRVMCRLACGLLNQLPHQPRGYPLWAAYRIILAYSPKMLDVNYNPALVHMPTDLGFGLLTKRVRKRALRQIEIMSLHRRAANIVSQRRKRRVDYRRKVKQEREAFIAARHQACITIQRNFRGYSARLIYAACSQARALAKQLVREMCDSAFLWHRVQGKWRATKGFLGKASISAFDIILSLSRGGPVQLQLEHSEELSQSPEKLDHSMVGGSLDINLAVRSIYPSLPYEVQEAHLATLDKSTKHLIPTKHCLHTSMVPKQMPSEPLPHILRVQLVGMKPVMGGHTEEAIISISNYTLKLFLCDKPASSSTKPILCKTDPSFLDEIIYIDLLNCSPSPQRPLLEIQANHSNQSQQQQRGGETWIARAALDAADLLHSLGRRITISLYAPLDQGGGVIFELALLLSFETAQRTESRRVAHSIVRHVLRCMRTQLDLRTPRVELTFHEAEIHPRALPPSVNGQAFSCRVKWNGQVAVATAATQAASSFSSSSSSQHIVWQKENGEATFALGIPEGLPQQELQVEVLLYVHHHGAGTETPVARAALSHRDIYCPEGSTRWFDLLQPSDASKVGRLYMHIISCFCPMPFWRVRLEEVMMAIPPIIRQAIDLVPQPRIEVEVLKAVDLVTDYQDLNVTVYWKGNVHATFNEASRSIFQPPPNVNSDDKTTVIFERSTKALCFFPAVHVWNRTPEFNMVIRGTPPNADAPVELAEVRLDRDDILLVHRSRPTELFCVKEPTKSSSAPSSRASTSHRVVQRLAGCLLARFTPVDVPAAIYSQLRPPQSRLCLSIRDVRHELVFYDSLHYMHGLHCRLIWKDVEVAATDEARGTRIPTWDNQVFMLPITSDADDPNLATKCTLPLLIQVFCSQRGGNEILIGELRPFNGHARSLPCSYYPFDIESVKGGPLGNRKNPIIGQLGMSIWIDHVDVDEETTALLVPQNDALDERALQPVTIQDLQKGIHMTTATIRGQTNVKERRLTYMEALSKTEEMAKELYMKAKEAAQEYPLDKRLNRYVRLLAAECDRATRAAKAAKVKKATQLALPPPPQSAIISSSTSGLEGIIETEEKEEEEAEVKKDNEEKKERRKQQRRSMDAKARRKKEKQQQREDVPGPTNSPPLGVQESVNPSAGFAVASTTPIPEEQNVPTEGDVRQQLSGDETTMAPIDGNTTEEQQAPAAEPGLPVLSDKEIALKLLQDPSLSPSVPIVHPSLYLRVVCAKGVASSSLLMKGSAPRVHVHWCGKRVGNTEPGSSLPSSSNNQAQCYEWSTEETFLLPLPPHIHLANLRLEVFCGSTFAGEIVLDGNSLPSEYLDPFKMPPTKYVTDFQLMDKDYSTQLNNFGKLGLYIIALQPRYYREVLVGIRSMIVDTIDKMIRTGEVVNLDEALLDEHDDPSTPFCFMEGHLDYIYKTYLRRQLTYKLQILEACNLPRASRMDASDPYLVVMLNGMELGRTDPIDDCLDPVFRNALFDIPFDVVMSDEQPQRQQLDQDDPQTGLLVEVYDSNSLTADVLLGQLSISAATLRQLLTTGSSSCLDINLEPQFIAAATAAALPQMRIAGHLMPRAPGKSRIDMKMLALHDLMEMPLLGNKLVLIVVTWNEQEVAAVEAKVSTSGKLVKNVKNVVSLPFTCDAVPADCSFANFPARLEIDIYALNGSGKNAKAGTFLGQVSTSGPFGVPMNDEDDHGNGKRKRSATYRLGPKVANPNVASDVTLVAGSMMLEFTLCEPTERIHAWLTANREEEKIAPKAQVRLLNGLNLPYVNGKLCSPMIVAFSNNRQVFRSSVMKETCFPVWDGEVFSVPLKVEGEEKTMDVLYIELYNESPHPPNYLGHIIIDSSITDFFSPELQHLRQDFVLLKKAYGSPKASEIVQGSLSLAFVVKDENVEENVAGLLSGNREKEDVVASKQKEGGEGKKNEQLQVEPQRWVALHLLNAKGLRKTDLLGKSDPYCLLFWKRRDQFRSSVIWSSLNPLWNEKFRLFYTGADYEYNEDLELRIMVFDKNVIGTDAFLGQVVLRGDQLLAGDNQVLECDLVARPDVAADAQEKFEAKIYLSFQAEEEQPYRKALEAMHLRVQGSYLAMDIVSLDIEEYPVAAPSPEEGSTATNKEGFIGYLVKLLYDQEEIGHTPCVASSRGEVQFDRETFIFPLSKPFQEEAEGAKPDEILPTYDLRSKPLQLQVMGVLPSSSPSVSTANNDETKTKNVGFVDLTLSDFTACPVFQCRYELASNTKLLLNQAKHSNHVVVRLACLTQPSPKPLPDPLGIRKRMPRLRLQLFGLLPEEEAKSVDSSDNPTQSFEIIYCKKHRAQGQLPLLQEIPIMSSDLAGDISRKMMLKRNKEVAAREYLLPFPDVKQRLKEVSLVVVCRNQDGVMVGAIRFGWEELTHMAIHTSDYKLTVTERSFDDLLPHKCCLTSRLVTPIQHRDSVTGKLSTSLRVKDMNLAYALNLEIPRMADEAEANAAKVVQTLVVRKDRVAKNQERKHFNLQGFPCHHHHHHPHQGRNSTHQPSRRIRMSVLQVSRKYTNPSGIEKLDLTAADCKVYWQQKLESILHIPFSRLADPDLAGSTCYLPIPSDEQMLRKGESSLSVEIITANSNPLRGVVVLRWQDLLCLPSDNQTDYLVRSGDEILASQEAISVSDVQVEALSRFSDVSFEENVNMIVNAASLAEEGSFCVYELSGLVVRLRVCIEASTPERPYLLVIAPQRARQLAKCNEFGSTRVPGLSQRQVYIATYQNDCLWHTSRPVWGTQEGVVCFADSSTNQQQQQTAAIPLQGPSAQRHWKKELDIQVLLYDFSLYSQMEIRKVIGLQCVARRFLAIRRMAWMKAKRQEHDQKWRASAAIISLAHKWALKKKRERAALVLTRVIKGAVSRRRLKRLVRTSYAKLHFKDLRYVAMIDDSLDGITPMHICISWNGKTVKEVDLPITTIGGFYDFVKESFSLPLKKVILDDKELLYVYEGTEYYVIDDAQLLITISKPASLMDFLSHDQHVARLVLTKYDLASLCQLSLLGDDSEASDLQTNYSLNFRRVAEGEEVAFESRIFASENGGGANQHTKALPNIVMVGLSMTSTRPLWIRHRDALSALEAKGSENGSAAQQGPKKIDVVKYVLDDLVTRTLQVTRSKPLWLRFAYGLILPHGENGTPITWVNPSCVVAWEGRITTTVQFVPDEEESKGEATTTTTRKGRWNPVSSFLPSEDVEREIHGAIELPPAICTNPDLTLVLYNDSPQQGRALIAGKTFSIDDLDDLKRERISRKAVVGSDDDAAEIFLNFEKVQQSKPGSAPSYMATATPRRPRGGGTGVAGVFLESAASTASSYGSNMPPTFGLGIYASKPVRPVTPQPPPPVALLPSSGGDETEDNSPTPHVDDEEEEEYQMTDWTQLFSEEYHQSYWMNSKTGLTRWTPPAAPTKRLTSGKILKYDGRRELHYYVNERGNKVFHFPKRTISNAPPSSSAL